MAETIARGLTPGFIVAQASAHNAPTLGNEYKVVNWLRAAAIIAQADPVARGLLVRDSAGNFRLPPKPGAPGQLDLNAAGQVNLSVEDTIHNLSDADFVFSIPAVTGAQAVLQTLASRYGYDPADAARYNTMFRNPALSFLSAERVLILYSTKGLGAVQARAGHSARHARDLTPCSKLAPGLFAFLHPDLHKESIMPDHVRSRLASSVAIAAAGTLLGIAAAGPAWGWGHSGHVGVSRLAMLNLPAELPKFLRAPQSAMEVGELGAEPDVSKSTGIVTGTGASGSLQTARTVHDAERDPGHYIDIDEHGLVLGGAVALMALPPTREAFDTAQPRGNQPGRPGPSIRRATCHTRSSMASSRCGKTSASGAAFR